MKHLGLFKTEVLFEKEKRNLHEPWVAYSLDINKVHYSENTELSIPSNEIWYETVDGNSANYKATLDYILSSEMAALYTGSNVLSEERDGDHWVLTFEEDITDLYITETGASAIFAVVPNFGLTVGTNITKIVLPNSVTSIGSSAFYGCSSLTSITIPDSVTSIGYGAFGDCSSLTDIYYEGSIFQWISIEKGEDWDSNTPPSLTIHYGKEHVIGNNEIWYTTTDGNVLNIPDVAEIFGLPYEYTLLSNIYENGKGVMVFDQPILILGVGGELDEEGQPTKVYPVLGNIGEESERTLSTIELPDSVTSIGDYSFYNCPSLTSINIPDSVTSIGGYAFSICKSLTSINIPDSVTSIGYGAFYECTSLTSINIPDSVTSIGDYAFWHCSRLTSITYSGTKAQWKAITKGNDWNGSAPVTSVTCSDGTTTL